MMQRDFVVILTNYNQGAQSRYNGVVDTGRENPCAIALIAPQGTYGRKMAMYSDYRVIAPSK